MENTPAPRATRGEWVGLAIIALPCMVYAMDLTVLNLALPAISTALSPSSSLVAASVVTARILRSAAR